MGCRSVGSTNTDTAGLGIILSFTIQAGLSFILSLWSISIELRHRELSRKLKGNGSDDTHSQGVDSTPDHRERCALGFKGKAVSRVLMEISDIQTFNGIALLIGAYARRRTLDLYHYHIVYDTISFTGISTAPALVLTFERSNVILLRAVSVFILLCLYIGFVIIFGIKLQSWNDDITGHCYISDNISNREAVHPYVDNVYLALTALYFCTALILCLGVAVYNMLRRLGLNRFLGVIKAYFLMDRRLWWSLPFPPLQVLKWELRIFKRILDQVSGWALDRQPGWAPYYHIMYSTGTISSSHLHALHSSSLERAILIRRVGERVGVWTSGRSRYNWISDLRMYSCNS
ncbi:hypothetical protein GGS26DRAFT_175556 [Hypomontagnella submonticulosa]|nr:hypothetical protein GGS26DRAFT_175556 [Hypomontagnella submonticulosa]